MTAAEGDVSINVQVQLSKALESGSSIQITFTNGAGLTVGNDKDINISPAPSGATITIEGPTTVAEFTINTTFDTFAETDETISFQIEETDDIEVGASANLQLTITDGSLAESPMVELRFNGNLLDTSGKGHNGVNHGTTMTNGKSGTPGTGILLSGASYITIPSHSDFDFSTNSDFAVSLWVSPAATQNDMGGTVNDIIRKWAGDAQGYAFGVHYYNSSFASAPNTLAAARYDGSGCANIPQVFSTAVGENYYHVVFMKAGGTVYLYVNNTLVGSTSDTTICGTTNITDLYIGCRGNLLRCFTGKVDDIRIYDRSLSPEEIEFLYSAL